MSKVVIVVYSLFVFLCAESMQVFDHALNFNRAMAVEYGRLEKLSDAEVMKGFLCCCKQADSVEANIKKELGNIIHNAAGRKTLLAITARLLPYVRCADSLEKLLQAIPFDEQTKVQDELRKAELVSLFFEALNVKGSSSVAGCINGIHALLDSLRDSPVEFPIPTETEACSRVFSGYSARKTRPASRINKCWDKRVHDVVSAFLPILREGMFVLELGSTTRYVYAQSSRCARICLSSTKPVITARCITGPLLCNKIEGVDVPVCYWMEDRQISADSGLHHEIFHHLVIGLELDESPHFVDFIPFLIKRGVDGLYVSSLKELYTDMDEFRNIIGLFSLGNRLYFDPCSEAAYLCSAGCNVRGTHKSLVGTIRYVPISFVDLLKNSVKGFQINGTTAQDSLKKLKWC